MISVFLPYKMACSIEQRNDSVNFGPVDGQTPRVCIYPEMMGTTFRQFLESNDFPDGLCLTVPRNGLIWKVRKEDGVIRSIQEWTQFSDPSCLLDAGLDAEQINTLVINRLECEFVRNNRNLNLPSDINEYSVVRLTDSKTFDIEKLTVISIASRVPDYFDLAVTRISINSQNNLEHLKYNNKSSCSSILNLTHSGDVGFTMPSFGEIDGGNHLGHSVTFNHTCNPRNFSETCVIWVSGYNRTKLTRFEKNKPTVLLVDSENKVVYFVPIRLDRATAGENTSAAVLTVTVYSDSSLATFRRVEGLYGGGDATSPPTNTISAAARLR